MKTAKRIVTVLLVAIMLFAFVPTSYAATPSIMNETEWELLKLTNDERTKAGLKPLSSFQTLQWCADVRGNEISRFFSHTRPDGSNCMTIFDGLKELNHYGENVAAGYICSEDVLNVWMNSQNGHKENILYPNFSHLSNGYVTINNDKYCRYWVQSFVGDCEQSIVACDETPIFDINGKLKNENVALILKCVHGTSYMPLVNTEYVCNSTAYGNATMRVDYDGKSFWLPCAVEYKDLNTNAWYYDSVVRATKMGLFSGTSDSEFSPGRNMTRAMLVSVLYRLEGEPDIAYTNDFIDVPRAQWYSKAVSWAASNGIVSGMTETRFSPNGNITREQMVTILYRYAAYNGISTFERRSLDGFGDLSYVHDYARIPLEWGYAKGLIQGKSFDCLDPLGNATRAEVCAIMIRYIDNVK